MRGPSSRRSAGVQADHSELVAVGKDARGLVDAAAVVAGREDGQQTTVLLYLRTETGSIFEHGMHKHTDT